MTSRLQQQNVDIGVSTASIQVSSVDGTKVSLCHCA